MGAKKVLAKWSIALFLILSAKSSANIFKKCQSFLKTNKTDYSLAYAENYIDYIDLQITKTNRKLSEKLIFETYEFFQKLEKQVKNIKLDRKLDSRHILFFLNRLELFLEPAIFDKRMAKQKKLYGFLVKKYIPSILRLKLHIINQYITSFASENFKDYFLEYKQIKNSSLKKHHSNNKATHELESVLKTFLKHGFVLDQRYASEPYYESQEEKNELKKNFPEATFTPYIKNKYEFSNFMGASYETWRFYLRVFKARNTMFTHLTSEMYWLVNTQIQGIVYKAMF